MRLLEVHNYYTQPGGEDSVFEAESALLRWMGHEVVTFVRDNDEIKKMNHMNVAMTSIWSRESNDKLKKLLRESRPDVVNFHNTFLLISPAAYYACKEAGVPVVQTLHNYRLICPAATFSRDGRICKECLGKATPWPGIVHGCWRGSRTHTAVVAAMITLHRLLKTWEKQVDLYIALTEFARKKLIEGGLPANKIVVKPNFVMRDPQDDLRDEWRGRAYALFVGRLSQKKGVWTMLMAWQYLVGIPLKVVGDGPLMGEVRVFVERQKLKNVEVLGRRHHDEVLILMRRARFLVFPSECYETFGMTIIEAFACGTPVVASRLGAMAEVVEDFRTGVNFDAGNPDDLAAKVEWVWTHSKKIEEMGKEARKEYERKYTAEINYKMLMDIYETAIERARGKCRI
jgi:glycosyltransferase involved in cell wall biosynthesis